MMFVIDAVCGLGIVMLENARSSLRRDDVWMGAYVVLELDIPFSIDGAFPDV